MIEVWLKKTSLPIVFITPKNAYEKGSFYCVLKNNNRVRKFPIADIFCVDEPYDFEVEESKTNE